MPSLLPCVFDPVLRVFEWGPGNGTGSDKFLLRVYTMIQRPWHPTTMPLTLVHLMPEPWLVSPFQSRFNRHFRRGEWGQRRVKVYQLPYFS